METGFVPIGTVIDWWRNEDASIVMPFPSGYQICDGSVINNPDSPLNGQNVPDLSDRFVLGVVHASGIGTTGGQNYANFSGVTDSGYAGGSDPGRAPYYVKKDLDKWGNDYHFVVHDGHSDREGQHRHGFSGGVSTMPPYYGLLKLMRIV